MLGFLSFLMFFLICFPDFGTRRVLVEVGQENDRTCLLVILYFNSLRSFLALPHMADLLSRPETSKLQAAGST